VKPEESVIYLARCAVNGDVPDRKLIDEMDLDKVCACAAKHLLGTCVSLALESAGCRDLRTGRAIAESVRKAMAYEAAYRQISQRMEAAGIWHMLLKGGVLRHDYPKPVMREMADYDLLFDGARAADVRAIMEDLGFTTVRFGSGNHDVYHKLPILSFEMHHALFGPQHAQKLYEYYKDIGSRLISDDGLHRRFTTDDFYVYMVAHEYKHYAGNGTGLRSFLDVYVFLHAHADELDMRYVRAETEKLGIAAFERASRSLAMHLFGGGQLTAEDLDMLEYVTHSTVFGTYQHHLENEVRKKGRLRYFLSRLYLTRDEIQLGYPFFYRHRILLPIFPIYRLVNALINRRSTVMAEFEAMRAKKQQNL